MVSDMVGAWRIFLQRGRLIFPAIAISIKKITMTAIMIQHANR